MAADFETRAREAGHEAEASVVSKSVTRAQGGRAAHSARIPAAAHMQP
ncbi:hypothetical protein ACFVTM_08950 [Arthrobacter sp. NPDC058130]